MDTGAFDRLARLLGASGDRRSVLGALLGAALIAPVPATVVARTKRQGRRTRRGKSTGSRSEAVAAAGRTKDVMHCESPGGLDLNDFYGVSDQIVAAFCPLLNSGQRWRPANRWDTAPTFDAYDDFPDGFAPVGDTPQEDFIAKFQAVKYVIDPGTRREKTVVFPKDASLFVLQGDDGDVTSPITLGALGPLPVGEHAVDVYWHMSAKHCDGLGDELDVNCLAAGEFFYARWEFEATAGHR